MCGGAQREARSADVTPAGARYEGEILGYGGMAYTDGDTYFGSSRLARVRPPARVLSGRAHPGMLRGVVKRLHGGTGHVRARRRVQVRR